MPIITFSEADILRSKILEAGWYPAKITKVDGPKKSKAGDSMNFDVYFTLAEGTPAPGKELIRTFNSKAIGMMVPLISAIRNQAVAEEKFQFDTDELLGKQLDIKVTVDTYEGQLKNVAESYLPLGTGSSAKLGAF